MTKTSPKPEGQEGEQARPRTGEGVPGSRWVVRSPTPDTTDPADDDGED